MRNVSASCLENKIICFPASWLLYHHELKSNVFKAVNPGMTKTFILLVLKDTSNIHGVYISKHLNREIHPKQDKS